MKPEVFTFSFGRARSDRGESGVEIAGYHHRSTGLLVSLCHLQELSIKGQLALHPFHAAPAVGEVDVEEDERLIFMNQDPPIGVQWRVVQSPGDVERCLAGIDASATVALFLRPIPACR